MHLLCFSKSSKYLAFRGVQCSARCFLLLAYKKDSTARFLNRACAIIIEYIEYIEYIGLQAPLKFPLNKGVSRSSATNYSPTMLQITPHLCYKPVTPYTTKHSPPLRIFQYEVLRIYRYEVSRVGGDPLYR